MAVSKRLRFEILRRDNHACRYCGAKAPDVKLVVDHVVPEALGGKTEPSNLVAACEPCNSGKTSTTPDGPTVDQVATDALRWARAIKAAAAEMLAQRQAREGELEEFLETWNRGRSFARLPEDWEGSILRFRAAGLPLAFVLDAARKAHANRKVAGPDVFRYMCGIAWGMVNELQESARALAGGSSTTGDVLSPRDQLADRLLAEIRDAFPDVAAEGVESGYADIGEPAEWRALGGEESIHVLSVANALFGLLGHLQHFDMTVDRGFRRLSLADQKEVEERLAHDLHCAGDEDAGELERTLHRMRHMLALAERDEG